MRLWASMVQLPSSFRQTCSSRPGGWPTRPCTLLPTCMPSPWTGSLRDTCPSCSRCAAPADYFLLRLTKQSQAQNSAQAAPGMLMLLVSPCFCPIPKHQAQNSAQAAPGMLLLLLLQIILCFCPIPKLQTLPKSLQVLLLPFLAFASPDSPKPKTPKPRSCSMLSALICPAHQGCADPSGSLAHAAKHEASQQLHCSCRRMDLGWLHPA